MPTIVTRTPAAASEITLAHFEAKLDFETDCWDVHHALTAETSDFVLLDVRGAAAYVAAHVPGAVSLPHTTIEPDRMAAYPAGSVFVVYCAGPHCNGADKAAVRLASLGLPVKLMLGGMVGWREEGFPFEHGEAPGSLPRAA